MKFSPGIIISAAMGLSMSLTAAQTLTLPPWNITSTTLVAGTILIPTDEPPFTVTVPACDTVPAYAVVGAPKVTFAPGTQTIYLPPQFSPLTKTFVNNASMTEIYILTNLPGTCEEPGWMHTSTSSAAAPLSTCPVESCSGDVSKAAEKVINVINKATARSQHLYGIVYSIEASSGSASPHVRRSLHGAPNPDVSRLQRRSLIGDIVRGCQTIASTITEGIPTIDTLPPFPGGCDATAIYVALVDFVRVLQELLNVLIAKEEIIENMPFLASELDGVDSAELADSVVERTITPIGAAVISVLHPLAVDVDTLAFTLLNLIPALRDCVKAQSTAIAGTFEEALTTYSD